MTYRPIASFCLVYLKSVTFLYCIMAHPYPVGYPKVAKTDRLIFDLKLVPAVALGAGVGILTLNRIPQKAFDTIIRILTALAALKLLFG